MEAIILEKLPENDCYQMTNFVVLQKRYKITATSSDVTTESLDWQLAEFQIINDVCLKIKMEKKPTKGFFFNYYTDAIITP